LEAEAYDRTTMRAFEKYQLTMKEVALGGDPATIDKIIATYLYLEHDL
jgi:hypothetical protein